MKIKTIFITAVLIIGAGTATSYYVKRSQETNAKKVEVVPVPSVNSAEYSMMDSGTISGTIVSKDTQVVTLDTSHELVDVYVQQGDRVKKGDKLLEYDMLGDELKAEMEELTKLGLELSLEGMKKDLEILRSGRMPESMTGGDSGDVGDSSDDDDDDGIGISGDDSDDEDVDTGLDADGRSVNSSVQRRGGGAVAAADTLAEEYSDWDSLEAASGLPGSSWTRESLTKALMERGLLAQPVGDGDEQTTPQDGGLLDDSVVDLLLSGAVGDEVIDAILNGDIDPAALEVLLNGEENTSSEETALSLQELFASINQQEGGTIPDAIPAAEGEEPVAEIQRAPVVLRLHRLEPRLVERARLPLATPSLSRCGCICGWGCGCGYSCGWGCGCGWDCGCGWGCRCRCRCRWIRHCNLVNGMQRPVVFVNGP